MAAAAHRFAVGDPVVVDGWGLSGVTLQVDSLVADGPTPYYTLMVPTTGGRLPAHFHEALISDATKADALARGVRRWRNSPGYRPR